MLSVSTGYDPRYLTAQVGTGREGYYLRAVREGGEPPGRWMGPGAEALGLVGEVDPTVMEALYNRFVDPRDERVMTPSEWDAAAKLGKAPRKFKSVEERLAAALAAEPDATPERVEEIRAQVAASQRQAVHFLDLTFSPQKSVSVLWASFAAQAADADRRAEALAGRLDQAPEDGAERRQLDAELGAARADAALWRQRADVVWGAIEAGADAALDYTRREAGYVRVGYHGRLAGANGASVGRFEKAGGWVTARFRHHESRDHDVQLHVHHAVLNRVQCADGEWRTLDSRGIHRVRPAAAAVGERVVEDYLSRELGVEWATRPDGKAREIVGIGGDVRDLFSTRREAVRTRLGELVAWYEQRHGRTPTPKVLSRLSLMATLDSRAAKGSATLTRDQQVARWAARVDETLDMTLGALAEQVTGRVDPEAVAAAFDPDAVIAAGVARAQEAKAHWTKYDLVRAINTELPDMLGSLGPQVIEQLLDDLAETALTDRAHGVVSLAAPEVVETPAELRRADGESIYRPHGATRYATSAHLAAEGRIETAAREHRAPTMPVERVDELVAESGLGGDQYAAVLGILTSGRGVDVLVGPPGTGKSYTVAQLAAAWEAEHGTPVLGLATSQRAADVLAEEGVANTANISKWLLEQHRIGRDANPNDRSRWRLRRGQLVVVDEAGMTSTDQLAAVEAACRAAGAKLVLSGDPEQLTAVGAGGAMRLLTLNGGEVYALHEVRRFREQWEREASLRLREHDTTALAEYDRHGRILGGSDEQMTAAAVRGYVGDTLAGRRSLLIVDTNERAAQVSAQVRAQLVALGRVEPVGLMLHDGTAAGAGDRIQARRNAPTLRGPDRHPVTNRDIYVVMGRTEHGELVVRRDLGAGPDGADRWGPMVTLPPGYVSAHVELAYAVTEHGGQGKTVDTGHGLISRRTDASGVLVDVTRGRERNTLYVITREADEHGRQPAEQDAPTPVGLLSQILGGAQPEQSATEVLREEFDTSERLDFLGGIWGDLVDTHYKKRVAGSLRWMLGEQAAQQVLADEAAGPLARLLHAAAADGRDLDQVLIDAIHYSPAGGRAKLGAADSLARALHWRVKQVVGDGAGPQSGRPQLDADLITRSTAALRAALGPDVAAQVTADEAAPALWRMVQAAAASTGRDPADLLTAAVNHEDQGGRARLLRGNDAHSVARLLHWRVRDVAGGADIVAEAYEQLGAAEVPTAHQQTGAAPVAPAGRPALDPAVIAAAEAALHDVLPAEVAAQVTADEAAPALWRMVQAAATSTGRDPADLLAAAVEHEQQGGRARLLRGNDAHSVARLLHWRVRDVAGADTVTPAYEQLGAAEVPAYQPTLFGHPTPAGAEVPEVEEVAAVSGGEVVGQGALDLDLPEPSAVLPGGYADRTPHQMTGPVGRHARALAEACDRRAVELGDLAGAEPPAWAEALGPAPDDPVQRLEWTRRAAAVAAWREHYGHSLPDGVPLGPCPPAGNVPARQAWQAAWDALGRPEDVRETATLTDAQLRQRVAAWRREQAWAPDYVGDDLRRAEQAAAEYAARAQITRAELASGRVPADQRDAHAARLAGYEQLAAGLNARREELAEVDRARTAWHTETTPVRESAEQAAAEMRRRGLDPEQVTLRDRARNRLDRLRGRAAEQQRRQQQDQAEVRQARGGEREAERVECAGQLALDLPTTPEPVREDRDQVDEQHRGRGRDQAALQRERAEDARNRATQPEYGREPQYAEAKQHQAEVRQARGGEREPERVECVGQLALDLPTMPEPVRDDRDQVDERQARAERIERLRQAARDQHRAEAAPQRRRAAEQLLANRAARDTGRKAGRADAAEQLARARDAAAEVQRRQAERTQAGAEQQRRDAARTAQQQHQQRTARRAGPTLSR